MGKEKKWRKRNLVPQDCPKCGGWVGIVYMTQSWYCYCNVQGCEYTEEVYYTVALELLNMSDDVSYDYDGTPYTTPGPTGGSYWSSEVVGAVAGAAKQIPFVAHRDHWQDLVQVGEYTKLTCSASRDIPRKKNGGYDWKYPDLGVYLSCLRNTDPLSP